MVTVTVHIQIAKGNESMLSGVSVMYKATAKMRTFVQNELALYNRKTAHLARAIFTVCRPCGNNADQEEQELQRINDCCKNMPHVEKRDRP